ncbi:MAG: peptidylprolyl isomerase [Ilumatobacteraceae bacterium]
MGTEKRERQKANKAQKQQELQKAESRRRSTRIAVIVVGAIVAVFALVWIAGRFSDDEESATDTAEPATVPTVAEGAVPDTTEAPAPTTTVEANVAPADIGCPPTDGSAERYTSFSAPPPDCLDPDASYTAVITTNKGEFTVELDQEQAPATVNNFVFLARYGYFDATECHRIIPGFVVQCGDPTGTGTGDPGYRFEDELPEEGEYEIGSIAMANSGPDSNGSQFFVITGEQGAALPPAYSLFGGVVAGFDETVVVMEAAGTASGDPSEPIVIISVEIIET